jgi:selenocysteine lyase/cysteine desulfurase
MGKIQKRVSILIDWLLEQIKSLAHSDGKPLVKIHGPEDSQERGGTIAFNVLDKDGEPFDIRLIESMANEAGISLRTGCFCNPGAGEVAFNVSRAEIERFFEMEGLNSFDQLRSGFIKNYGRDIGAVRVSLGIVTNFADIQAFLHFLSGFLDQSSHEYGVDRIEELSDQTARDSA